MKNLQTKVAYSLVPLAIASPIPATVGDGFDAYNVPAAIREAVVLGSYNTSNEMNVAVIGSVAGMEFAYQGFMYTYMPGDAGTLVWVKNSKLASIPLTPATSTALGVVKVGNDLAVAADGLLNLSINSKTNHPPVGYTGLVAPYFYRTEYINSFYTHQSSDTSNNPNRVVSSYDPGGTGYAFVNFRTPNGSSNAYGEYVSPGQVYHLKPFWCKEIRYFTRHEPIAQNRKLSVRRMSAPTIVIEEVIIYANSAQLPAGGADHWTPDKTFYLPGYDSYMMVLESLPTINPNDGTQCSFFFHGDFILN